MRKLFFKVLIFLSLGSAVLGFLIFLTIPQEAVVELGQKLAKEGGAAYSLLSPGEKEHLTKLISSPRKRIQMIKDLKLIRESENYLKKSKDSSFLSLRAKLYALKLYLNSDREMFYSLAIKRAKERGRVKELIGDGSASREQVEETLKDDIAKEGEEKKLPSILDRKADKKANKGKARRDEGVENVFSKKASDKDLLEEEIVIEDRFFIKADDVLDEDITADSEFLLE